MLTKLFTKALTLEIGDQTIAFNTLAEFEFALAGRTDVPSRKLAELAELTPEQLKHEAKAIKVVEQQFVEIMSRAMESPGAIAKLLRELDILVFSQDHSWRDIVRALNDKEQEYDELRRVVLVKYMQYLRSRQDMIKQAYKLKKRAAPANQEPDVMATMMSASPLPAQAAAGNAAPGLRETVIFDSVIIDQESDLTSEFTRLLKGEATTIRLHPGNSLDIKLSKHPFRLVTGETCELVDDQGRTHPLEKGKNIVGRDSVCNVVVDNAYRDVSRIHMIIELTDTSELRFTDLSSHGTFLPTRALG